MNIPFKPPGQKQGKIGPFLTRVYVPPDGPTLGFISKGYHPRRARCMDNV